MTAATIAAPRRAAPAGPHVLMRVARRVVLPALALVILLVVLAYAVFPTRSWLDQRQTIVDREFELAELNEANETLRSRVAALGTQAEIERIARRDHGLVLPGEEAYAVLPAAPAPVRMPPAWPFTELAEALAR